MRTIITNSPQKALVEAEPQHDGAALQTPETMAENVARFGGEAITPPVLARAPARVLPPALESRKWKPGQSGNPTGRTAAYGEAMRICREASPEAARKMVHLMESPDHRVAYMAANSVMERAWGKPKEFDPNTQQKPPLDLGKLAPEDLAILRKVIERALSNNASEPETGQ